MMSHSRPSNPRGAVSSRREVVERAESYVRDRLETRVAVSELCRVVGLSERGLRYTFQRETGMSPKQYMLSVRLRGVRRALSDVDQATTVTGVATSFGFYELGRFAAAYREAFGEVPSQTLRGTRRQAC